MILQVQRPCGKKACGSLERIHSYTEPPLGETRFDLGGQVYHRHYDACSICGHFIQATDMDLGFLYDGAYADQTYGDRFRQTFDRIISLPKDKSDNEGRATYLLAQAPTYLKRPQSPKLLDVGSGLCVFPWRMKQAGWLVTALDPDPRAAQHARDVVGVDGVSGDFMTIDTTQLGLFDVITFNKVLEHVLDPAAMLAKAHHLLEPDGIVYIELPDVAAMEEGPLREEFFIEHFHVFSMASFVLLAETAGFKVMQVERIREPSGKYTIRGIISSPGGGHNE